MTMKYHHSITNDISRNSYFYLFDAAHPYTTIDAVCFIRHLYTTLQSDLIHHHLQQLSSSPPTSSYCSTSFSLSLFDPKPKSIPLHTLITQHIIKRRLRSGI